MSQDAPQNKPDSVAGGSDASKPDSEEKPPVSGEDADSGSVMPRRSPSRWERRREKIRDEIERNRRGDYKIPTWVLVLALVAVVAGWATLIWLA